MARFIAYLEQEGGCDYTIACGKLLVELTADTHDAAVETLRQMVTGEDDNYSYTDEYTLSKITLYEVTASTSIDLKPWYAEVERREQEAERTEKLAQLAKLKKELGL